MYNTYYLILLISKAQQYACKDLAFMMKDIRNILNIKKKMMREPERQYVENISSRLELLKKIRKL